MLIHTLCLIQVAHLQSCVPKFMSDILCGCGMLRKETQLFVIGWGLLRPQDEMATFLGDQCE